MKAVPFQYRKNVQTLAFKIGISKSTVNNASKKGLLKHTYNSVRPILTDKNKADRVNYCLSFVQDGQFTDILERVDIDKKWFYLTLTELATSYILVPGETPPHQTCKHKSHIKKIMCFTAILRPWQNPQTVERRDGKIGTWFFTKQVPAQRSSKYQLAGTLETKCFKVGKKESVRMYLDNFLQGIIIKWLEWWPKKVRIQLDNAPAHPILGRLGAKIDTRLAEMNTGRWDIGFECQPTNSPEPPTATRLTWPSSMPFSHFNIRSAQRTSKISSCMSKKPLPSVLLTFVKRFG